jgi:hypothetical protein
MWPAATLSEIRPDSLNHGAHAPESRQQKFPVGIDEIERPPLAIANRFLGLLDRAQRMDVIPSKPSRLRNVQESESCIEVSLDEVSFNVNSTSLPQPVRHGASLQVATSLMQNRLSPIVVSCRTRV